MTYHMLMARKQVLVQLDDDLVERLDAYVEAHGTNRSAVLRTAAAALLDAEDQAADTAEADRLLVASYRQVPQDEAWVTWADHAQHDAFGSGVDEQAALAPRRNDAREPDGC